MSYFRFHRSKQLLPGVRLNIAKTGPSLSFGIRGARLNVAAQGVRTTFGIPGTGLSVITRKSWKQLADTPTERAHKMTMMNFAVSRFPGLQDMPPAMKTAWDKKTDTEKLSLAIQLISAQTLKEIINQLAFFEQYIVDHPDAMDADNIPVMRAMYNTIIRNKKSERRMVITIFSIAGVICLLILTFIFWGLVMLPHSG